MKKISILGLSFIIAGVLFACGGDNAKYEYSKLGGQLWLSGNIVKKKDKKQVLWFQFYDQKDESNYSDIVWEFNKAKDTVGSYPAAVVKDSSIKILVAQRFEIDVRADSGDPEFKNTDKLKAFLQTFDLKGLEKQKGGKLSPKELEKFIPKLAKNI